MKFLAFNFGLWKKICPLIIFLVLFRSTELKSLILSQNYIFLPLKLLFSKICRSGSVWISGTYSVRYVNALNLCVCSLLNHLNVWLLPVKPIFNPMIKYHFSNKIFWEILTSVQSSQEQDETCPKSFRFLAVISNLTPIRMTMYKLSAKKPPVAASTQLMFFPKV